MSDDESDSAVQFFPDFDGTHDSGLYDEGDLMSDPDDDSGSDGKDSSKGSQDSNAVKAPIKPYWRNAAYYRLPENVRAAIDVAKMKSKHTEFWYRLQTLNDKIFVFRSVFYTRMPTY
jgi:hypothetical protein